MHIAFNSHTFDSVASHRIEVFTSMQIIKQGAEARLYLIQWQDRQALVKHRFKKHYRHPLLDEKLTMKRNLQEARALQRMNEAGLDTPTLYLVDPVQSCIYMEYVQGLTVKETLLQNKETIFLEHFGQQIGAQLATMHNLDCIHGDLTTSNILIREKTQTLVWIDFGLSYVSSLPEDKGTSALFMFV
jgi:TP53 regulating kinase-like protein